jgi:hypothetical protein
MLSAAKHLYAVGDIDSPDIAARVKPSILALKRQLIA